MHAIAEVQRQGGTAALIDAEHAFDPVYSKVHKCCRCRLEMIMRAHECCDLILRWGPAAISRCQEVLARAEERAPTFSADAWVPMVANAD